MRQSHSTGAMPDHVFDCIGVGFGPSNIALAIAMEETGFLDNVLFLEAQAGPSWHPGMMLTGTDIQHNPLRDFVTPRNPQSPYGFLSYLKAKNRLFDFLNLDAPYPPRTEYAGYVEWVAAQFADFVRWGTPVETIEAVQHEVHGPLTRIVANGETYLARTLSFGTGRSALVPKIFQPHAGDRLIHLNDYLPSLERWISEGVRRIVVIGGSQSAAEIILDIAGRGAGIEVTGISRRFGFKLKDLSPFTERIYMPEFVDYFFGAPEAEQNEITRELWRSNYGAADHDVIAALNMLLYEQKVTGQEAVRILFNAGITRLSPLASGGFALDLVERGTGTTSRVTADAIILATGYRNFGDGEEQEPFHPLLAGLAPQAAYRSDGGVAVARDFGMVFRPDAGPMPAVFLNGVCESSHGFGDAGSFSLLSTRSSLITASIEAICRPGVPVSAASGNGGTHAAAPSLAV
ncbi:MAG: SidA/IucD/PvdA family monooxygenase [Hyphomicrobiales bacterium]